MALLTDRTAVVTGGASGIGRAIARRFAAEGADVVVADVREHPREGDRPTHKCIEAETDAEARYVRCDVTDSDDMAAAIAAADDLGGVDALVNNAGVFEVTPLDELTVEAFDRMMAVNARSGFLASKLAAPRMREAGGGAIVNLSSVSGIEGGGAYAHYSASKGAVRLLTYALAEALGPDGIRVNAVHPGPTETQMIATDLELGTDAADAYRASVPLGKLARPSEVADVALFLASDLASHVTAESVVVDGGDVNTRGLR